MNFEHLYFPKGTLQRDIQRTGEYLKQLLRLEKFSNDPKNGLVRSYAVNYGNPMTKRELLKRIEFNKARLKTLLGELK